MVGFINANFAVRNSVEHYAKILYENGKGKKYADMEAAKRAAWHHAYGIIQKMMAQMDNQTLLKQVLCNTSVSAIAIETILMKMYNGGIQIKGSDVEMLREAATSAAKTNTPMLIVPCHKSHIDYLVVSYVFYRLGLKIPHIAAGDNLQMPIVGSIFKNAGAFFIRRQWGNDPLYISLMREYIQLLLRQGNNIEVFIEGGRSRIGKLLQPKLGILKIVTESVISKAVKDVLIVPVSIGYDKVIETSAYVDELLGASKEKESLSMILNNVSLLNLKHGTVCLSFSQPFSLRGYVDSKAQTKESMKIDKNTLIQSLGFKILGDINSVSVIMPTALVGTVLLTLRGRGVGKEELVRKINWIKQGIIRKGGRVADFGSYSTFAIVERAAEVLHDLVGSHSDLIETVYFPKKRFELSYYRNQVIHMFISESVLSVAFYSTIKGGGAIHDQKVLLDPNLIEDAYFISSLLKYEFIFNPGGIKANLLSTIQEMQRDNILEVEQETGVPGQATLPLNPRKWVKLADEERRIGRENFDFYCFLLWPFIETYWLASMCIFSLIPENHAGFNSSHKVCTIPPNAWILESQFLDRCQFFAKTLYYEGDLSYFESINKETLKNAFSRFVDMGIIIKSNLDQPPLQIHSETVYYKKPGFSVKVAIHPFWYPKTPMPATFKSHLTHDQNSRAPGLENEKQDSTSVWYYYRPNGKLWDLCENISKFRREGKNRRDTSTVSSRVLRLTRQSCYWAFESKKGPLYTGPKL